MKPRKNSITGPFKKEDLIYLAGYVDGEGSFSATKKGQISLRVSNTHKPTIKWLSKTFGGLFYSVKRKKINPNHRPIYSWIVVQDQARELIDEFYLFLKEKRKQADLAIKIHSLPKVQRKKTRFGTPEKLKQKRLELSEKLKELKHIPWVSNDLLPDSWSVNRFSIVG